MSKLPYYNDIFNKHNYGCWVSRGWGFESKGDVCKPFLSNVARRIGKLNNFFRQKLLINVFLCT